MKPVGGRNGNEEQVVCTLMDGGHTYTVKGGSDNGDS